jgi:hypothetical protein
MKTLRRALVAIVAIAGSAHAAPLPAAEAEARGATPDRAEHGSVLTSPAPSTDAAAMPTVAELRQRVRMLEEELASLRARDAERARLPVESDPAFSEW